MSTAVRFRDHEDFHRAAWQMALLGGLAGLVAHLALAGSGAAWPPALWPLGAALGAVAPAVRQRRPAVVVVGLLALTGGVMTALVAGLRTEWSVLALTLPYAAALGFGLRGRRLLVALGLGAVVALLARHASLSLVQAPALASLPGWGLGALAGAAFSFVSVAALLPRHVQVVRDPVAGQYAELAPHLQGEIRELVERARALWTEAGAGLDPEDVDRQTLRDGVLRVLDVARRWNAARAEGAADGSGGLDERIEALDRRIESTVDAVAARQYRQARTALVEQRRTLGDIATNRERVLARLHNYLAAMERFRLAVINVQSTDVSRDAGVEPLLADLTDLGDDIDSAATALDEADRV